ncbi:hypothetical protein BV22DRAFT_1125490 [Leucogyrophana mollusca]|uniref:Uncharacterized protein n=1 Tax=Leucogyrophana mollusca TaxID=85980 RepID=A0ACB8BWB0_9AGAM|nr:hypothetical protein BV22DRAFT_1125490 [Leucogyrophana mollusca]
MHSFSFVTIALYSTLLVSAASPYSRRQSWLQQNGPAAKALNDQYSSLTPDSSCNDGDIACIDGQFAHCYQNHYFLHSCPSDWSCAAIPNEWSSGTTTTCDSNDNIAYRFSQAGVSETKRSVKRAEPVKRSLAQLQANGPAAKALNQEYATLTASSNCTDGAVACVQGQYAHCYQNRYLTWSCPSDWTCQALPNEWSTGTTTTCAYGPDAQWRLQEAGAL